MSKITTLLLCYTLIILSGCAGIEVSIDKEIEPYLVRAREAAEQFEIGSKGLVSYSFVDSFTDSTGANKAYVGVCKTYEDGSRHVYLKKGWWDLQTDLGRVSLVTHEMLHCEYRMAHTEYGIMGPNIGQTIHAIANLGLEEALFEAFQDKILLGEKDDKHSKDCNHVH